MRRDRQDIARWLRGQRAAEKRAHEARKAAPHHPTFEDALELWDLRPELFDEPLDAVRVRETAAAREAWKKLRRDWPERCRPANRLLRALAESARALEELPAPSMIIGGLAVIAHGVARTTRDLAVAVGGVALAGGPRIIEWSLSVLRKRGVAPRIDDAAHFAAEVGVLLLVHRASGVEIDISLASLGFEEEALSMAERRRLAGVIVSLARPEDLVIYESAEWHPRRGVPKIARTLSGSLRCTGPA